MDIKNMYRYGVDRLTNTITGILSTINWFSYLYIIIIIVIYYPIEFGLVDLSIYKYV